MCIQAYAVATGMDLSCNIMFTATLSTAPTSHVHAGLCCGVDLSCNFMFAATLSTARASSVFNFNKIESTGTASWTLYAPVGAGISVTGFHQETKKRRSYNCGRGDMIVQLLASHSQTRYSLPPDHHF